MRHYTSQGWVFVGWSDDGDRNTTRTITVPDEDGAITYTANFSWSSPLDYMKATETYQDKIGYDSGNNTITYPTGSFTINAVVFTGAGLAAANLNKFTPVWITIGNWQYQGSAQTLSDDPKYKNKATKATLPLTYTDANGKTNSAGTVTLSFGKKSTTLAITAKTGKDTKYNDMQTFIDADNFVNSADPNKTVPVGDSVEGTIQIGDYSEWFTNIVLTGTNAVKNTKAKDGNTYPLNTVKIKGVSKP